MGGKGKQQQPALGADGKSTSVVDGIKLFSGVLAKDSQKRIDDNKENVVVPRGETAVYESEKPDQKTMAEDTMSQVTEESRNMSPPTVMEETIEDPPTIAETLEAESKKKTETPAKKEKAAQKTGFTGKLSPVKDMSKLNEDELITCVSNGAPLTKFEWRHGGAKEKVELVANFSSWTRTFTMQREGDKWTVSLPLIAGEYQYKYLVDGKWMYDITTRNGNDGIGNYNNFVVIS